MLVHSKWSRPADAAAVRGPRRPGRLSLSAAATALVLSFVLVSAGSTPVLAATHRSQPARPGAVARCPWLAAARRHRASPQVLAREVVARMSLSQKANFVVMKVRGHVENSTIGVRSLCIPALTSTDGPDGVASSITGVTQFPSSMAVAASFDPSLARSLGVAIGQEARVKGFDVLQGPDLNLVRVPQWGRAFETYGEDPALASAIGVAVIDGIQSQGVMADAKHFTGYTQETARARVDQLIPVRALAELYDVPFEAAVTRARVASIMCALGSLNGVNDCSSRYLYGVLKSWGFTGFTRTDYRAVAAVAPAFTAGLSVLKPGSASQIVRLVRAHRLAVAALDRAVTSVLTEMFSFGLIAHPRRMALDRTATNAAHARLALRLAEAGVVLVKNRRSILPLSPSPGSIAVIGTDAKTAAVSTGGGSSTVRAPYVVTPLEAIIARWGKHATITYRTGGPRGLELNQLQFSELLSGKPPPKQIPITEAGEPGKADLRYDFARTVTRAIATADRMGKGVGWNSWRVVLRPRRSGTYEFALQEVGDTWFSVNGRTLFASPGIHGPADWATTLPLIGSRHYTLAATWFSVDRKVVPKLGVSDVSSQIAKAVSAARRARVAIVFAGSFATEGADQLSLSLPGDANALISAVAAANPHTIVVLNTGGAVYMPWIKHVQAVLEAWYPGQMDGTAIADVLGGTVDPSGRLPVSFPARTTAQPTGGAASYPGVDSTVHFGSGLDVGYRWFQLHHVRPLFPFGFGLSYTTFALSQASVSTTASGVVVPLTVTNTGTRAGDAVVQAYVHYPAAAGEPPYQLRAFAKVGLAAGQSQAVTLTIPPSGFQIYRRGRFTTVAGTYGVDVGWSSADLPVRLSVPLR